MEFGKFFYWQRKRLNIYYSFNQSSNKGREPDVLAFFFAYIAGSDNFTNDERGWFQWFVKPFERESNVPLWQLRDVPITAGFAMRSWKIVKAATVRSSTLPVGIARLVRNRQLNGRRATAISHLTWPQRQKRKRKSIPWKLQNEEADNAVSDLSVNPAPNSGGVFLFKVES